MGLIVHLPGFLCVFLQHLTPHQCPHRKDQLPGGAEELAVLGSNPHGPNKQTVTPPKWRMVFPTDPLHRGQMSRYSLQKAEHYKVLGTILASVQITEFSGLQILPIEHDYLVPLPSLRML